MQALSRQANYCQCPDLGSDCPRETGSTLVWPVPQSLHPLAVGARQFSAVPFRSAECALASVGSSLHGAFPSRLPAQV